MINKYFTPDTEDLCIGYECEYNYARAYTDEFIPTTIKFKDEDNIYSDELTTMIHLIDDGAAAIRVPYLTKEQIEAEGWYSNNNFPIEKFKKVIEVDVEVIYNYETHYLFITIPGKIMFVEPNVEYRSPKFSGECKDINTFRKIIKLLGI